MFLAYLVVTVVTIAANAGIAVVDLSGAAFVLANSDEVSVPRSWIPWLASLKLAGAVGLLLGLVGVRSIGIAAAIGLVLFFIGAVATHLRTRVLHNIAFPGGYLALAVASLLLLAAR
ncbi:DoxX family protein [Streptacidiphilus sp. PAMC 29251]